MIDLVIRRALAEEFGIVSELYRRSSLSNDGDREALSKYPEALEFDGASISEHRTRVAVCDGIIVGFATTRSLGDVTELDDLFVDPQWMRRGAARALVADVVAMARAAGTVRIEVTANGHALGFYEAVGFIGHEVVETQFATGTRMHLDIEP
jgi:GNAT superfamily N-acetyltransferase